MATNPTPCLEVPPEHQERCLAAAAANVARLDRDPKVHEQAPWMKRGLSDYALGVAIIENDLAAAEGWLIHGKYRSVDKIGREHIIERAARLGTAEAVRLCARYNLVPKGDKHDIVQAVMRRHGIELLKELVELGLSPCANRDYEFILHETYKWTPEVRAQLLAVFQGWLDVGTPGKRDDKMRALLYQVRGHNQKASFGELFVDPATKQPDFARIAKAITLDSIARGHCTSAIIEQATEALRDGTLGDQSVAAERLQAALFEISSKAGSTDPLSTAITAFLMQLDRMKAPPRADRTLTAAGL